MVHARFIRLASLVLALIGCSALAVRLGRAAEPIPVRLVLTRADGSTIAYQLSAIRRIDTSSSGLVIVLRDGAETHVALEDIRNTAIEPIGTTAVGEPSRSAPVAGIRLLPGYPNPMSTTATMPFELPRRAPVTLDVFAVTGQRVRTIARGELAPGRHTITWDGRDDRGRRVHGGIYFYRLRGATDARRVTLLP